MGRELDRRLAKLEAVVMAGDLDIPAVRRIADSRQEAKQIEGEYAGQRVRLILRILVGPPALAIVS